MINSLLSLPGFVIKVATQDYHPVDHISFASNHANAKPFETFIDMKNIVGGKPEQTMKQRLWPTHCVQGTPGADIIDEIDKSKVDMTIQKGMDERVEMYSAFSDSFGNLTSGQGGVSHDLENILREKQVSHVYVVGLAGDYCVKATAVDAAKAGFTSYVIKEAQRSVDRGQGWGDAEGEFKTAKVQVISIDGDEVRRVKTL